MAPLAPMPPVAINQVELARFGDVWARSGNKFNKKDAIAFGRLFDQAVGIALATMLGGLEVMRPNANALTPVCTDCVEVGVVRVIGGVRPQNFDVGYRPDGVRFAFDSKTLNDTDSVGKNWQNMINDLATEATTVHTRFPHAVVAFMVVIPYQCLLGATRAAMIETLERLGRRTRIDGPEHMAEAISLVLWRPEKGTIDPNVPSSASPLRIEQFHRQIEDAYVNRYKGLPPHATV